MFRLLGFTTLLAVYSSVASAGDVNGYHYDKPKATVGLVTAPDKLGHGHSFGPIPTIQPLPPVPALPPLPTPRGGNTQFIQTQTIFQTHPVASVKPLPNTYLPPGGSSVGKIVQQYRPRDLQSSPRSAASVPSGLSAPFAFSGPSAPAVRSAPSAPSPFTPGTGSLGSNLPNPSSAPVQPLRVPFGKQAIINFPTGSGNEATYQVNGRQLKQYAVIEIIDNDITQESQPFMNQPFFDSYRAHIGASGTGALPGPTGGIQLGSRSNAALLGQQRAAANDAIALGSGGLGFIRLANGNVHLGSGSLGYISGQQHSKEINEARTRTGTLQADPLNFGHGALGGPQFNRFAYRFK